MQLTKKFIENPRKFFLCAFCIGETVWMKESICLRQDNKTIERLADKTSSGFVRQAPGVVLLPDTEEFRGEIPPDLYRLRPDRYSRAAECGAAYKNVTS
jgi:hypothetical protein